MRSRYRISSIVVVLTGIGLARGVAVQTFEKTDLGYDRNVKLSGESADYDGNEDLDSFLYLSRHGDTALYRNNGN